MPKLLFFILFLLLISCQKKDQDEISPVETSIASTKLVFNYKTDTNSELYLANTDGTGTSQITNNSNYENWWGKISPDRKKIIYYRAPQGTNEDYAQADLMVYTVATAAISVLRAKNTDGWTIQAHAEWSPDGSEIVTCGTQSGVVHIFVIDSSSGTIKRQLSTTGGWNCDPSWSPDGTKIVFNRCISANCHSTFGNLDIYTMNSTNGSAITQLTSPDSKDDYDPYYSPDGNQIAWLHEVNNTGWSGVGVWSIKKMSAIGASQIFLINDTNINSKPSWSTDGSKLYFHRMAPLEAVKYRLFSILQDGSMLTEYLPFGAYSNASVGNISYPQN